MRDFVPVRTRRAEGFLIFSLLGFFRLLSEPGFFASLLDDTKAGVTPAPSGRSGSVVAAEKQPSPCCPMSSNRDEVPHPFLSSTLGAGVTLPKEAWNPPWVPQLNEVT